MAGIYIHIPFCRKACTYCNFHFSTTLHNKPELIDAMKQEIGITALYDRHDGHIDTLYFGGGTPSLLSEAELAVIFEAIHKKFSIQAGAEITLEANPDDINPSLLHFWKQLGINRISLGVQSFIEEELRWMNRAHHAKDSMDSITMIRDAGFTNFSVDLIYGTPKSTADDLLKNLEIIIENQIPHVSCYALTVEPKTALYHNIEKKQSLPVDSGEQAEQFLLLMNQMDENGYDHYEISNFAIPGYRSMHNSSYWQGKAYYGFGPAAHSFDGVRTRRWNVSNNAQYIQSLQKGILPFEEEVLTAVQQLNEYIMTALRTTEGIDMHLVTDSFGNKYTERLRINANKYSETGKLVIAENRIKLTSAGKLFADGIASDLFF